MTNMTLAIPEELIKLMRKHKQIKWSAVAREALWEEARKLELMDEILSKSKLKKEDVQELSKKINREIFEEFKKEVRR